MLPEGEAVSLDACEIVTTQTAGCRIVWHVAGEGRPLLLLHGNFGGWAHWVCNVASLSQRYRLLMPDLPGFGESDLPPQPYTVEGIADLLFESAQTIVKGKDPLTVVGFSFGSNFAGAIAARAGSAIDHLVIVSCGSLGLPREPIAFSRWRALTDREERNAAHRQNLAAQMFGNADAIDDQAVQIQATNAERRRFPAETLSSALPLRTILPRMSCPLSAIYGSADKSIGPHLQTRIDYFRALHRDANFAIVSGAGHWLQYEAPAAFEAALTSVLDEPRGGWIKSFARPPTVTA